MGVDGGIRLGSEVKVSQIFLISDILFRPVAAVQGSVHTAAVQIRAALLHWCCQTADVPLFASRGVRLLQLKSGHLLHLLNLAPVSAVTPSPLPPQAHQSEALPFPRHPLSTPEDPIVPPCTAITLPPPRSLLKSSLFAPLPASLGTAVITHPSHPQIKSQCIDLSNSGIVYMHVKCSRPLGDHCHALVCRV